MTLTGSEEHTETLFSSYEDVRVALLNRDLARSRDFERFEKGNILEKTVLVLHGSDHAQRRRYENALFRRNSLLTYESDVLPQSVELVLEAFLREDRPFDLVDFGGSCSVSVAARIAGIDMTEGEVEEARHLYRLVRVFSKGVSIEDAIDQDIDEIIGEVREALTDFGENFFDHSRQKRETYLRQMDERTGSERVSADLLSTLLIHAEDLGMDEGDLLRETAFFVGAGSHTNSQNVPSAIDELFQWRDRGDGDWGRIASDPSFAQLCVHEAFRLHPTTPIIKRKATNDTNVGERDIPAGAFVSLDVAAANRDQNAYGEAPDVYNPERTVSEGVPRYGFTFGGGMHTCIGRVLAGGMPAERETEDKLHGLVTLILQALVRRDVDRHPDLQPIRNTRVRRYHWQNYPVILT